MSLEYKKLCMVCNSESKSVCGKCKATYYCTRDHQRSDWKHHQHECFPSESVIKCRWCEKRFSCKCLSEPIIDNNPNTPKCDMGLTNNNRPFSSRSIKYIEPLISELNHFCSVNCLANFSFRNDTTSKNPVASIQNMTFQGKNKIGDTDDYELQFLVTMDCGDFLIKVLTSTLKLTEDNFIQGMKSTRTYREMNQYINSNCV